MYYLVGLILGLLLGWNLTLSDRLLRINNTVIKVSLVVLLVAMGMRIGADRYIVSRLGTLGLKSLALAAASIIGSIVAVQVIAPYLLPGPDTDGTTSD